MLKFSRNLNLERKISDIINIEIINIFDSSIFRKSKMLIISLLIILKIPIYIFKKSQEKVRFFSSQLFRF